MAGLSAVLSAGFLILQTGQATPSGPPIFQPGAPGTASRVVTAQQAVELARTSFTEGDVRFMQHMLVHHAQAVEMVELLKTRGGDATVGRLGERIRLSQKAEMALMRDWLSARGQPQAMPMSGDHSGMDHSAHGGVALMPGMLTAAQMEALKAADGIAFDRMFLSGMIQHHQGALDMVQTLLAGPNAAQDPMLSDFATSVVADQSSEILRMQTLLSHLSPASSLTQSTIQPQPQRQERP